MLDKSKKRKQKQEQKYYISKFDQTFNLRRSFKLKAKIREFLNAFEILKMFEDSTQNQIIQHFLDKIKFIDQFDIQIVIAQNQIVVVQNE